MYTLKFSFWLQLWGRSTRSRWETRTFCRATPGCWGARYRPSWRSTSRLRRGSRTRRSTSTPRPTAVSSLLGLSLPPTYVSWIPELPHRSFLLRKGVEAWNIKFGERVAAVAESCCDDCSDRSLFVFVIRCARGLTFCRIFYWFFWKWISHAKKHFSTRELLFVYTKN